METGIKITREVRTNNSAQRETIEVSENAVREIVGGTVKLALVGFFLMGVGGALAEADHKKRLLAR